MHSVEKGRALDWLSCGIAAGLALVIWMTFWRVMQCQFLNYDDSFLVIENRHVFTGLTLANIQWAFTHSVLGNWHPVTMLSHMLDCTWFGLNPSMHHFTNLLIHTANTLVLFFLLRDATGNIWRSAAVAVLFAIHPLRVESVAWVAERKDVLSTLFFLLTIGAYFEWVKRPGFWKYSLIIVLYCLAVMSKPMVVTLPFVLLLLDHWPLRRLDNFPKRLREKIPLFALSAGLSIATFLAQRNIGAMEGTFRLSFGYRIGNALVSYVRYLGKMFWPDSLAPLYLRLTPWPVWQVLLAILFLAAVTWMLVFYGRSKRYLLVGWLWYLGTLVPVIGLVQVGDQCMADRYSYVPSIGIAMLVVWGFSEILARVAGARWISGFAILAAVVLLAIMTRAQILYWKDTEVVFIRVLKISPASALAHNNLAHYYVLHQNLPKAKEQCTQALNLKPDYVMAHVNMGTIDSLLGHHKDSIEQYRAALAKEPDNFFARAAVAEELVEVGQLPEAVEQFRLGLQNPGHMEKVDLWRAEYRFADALCRLKRYDEAMSHYEQAANSNPKSFAIYLDMGVCYDKTGQMERAAQAYRKALQLNPASAIAHANLGKALVTLQDIDGALAHYERSVELFAGDADTQLQLGLLLAMHGKNEEARKHVNEALRLDPKSQEAKEALKLLDQGVP